MSEFEALRTELIAFRGDMDQRFTAIRGDMDHRFTAIDSRLATMDVKFAGIEARLANTATASTIYQGVLSMLVGAVAIVGGTIVGLKATGIVP